jgi:YD repeat-containing protein
VTAERPLLRSLGEAVRTVAARAAVSGAAALTLSAVDALPAYLAGEARDVRRARTVDEAERRLHARLLIPYYFPDTHAWPPRRIRFVAGSPGAAALEVGPRRDGAPLLIAQTVAPGELPARLVAPATELDRSEVAVGAARGRLARVIDEGEVAWQLTWKQQGRTVLIRSRGPVEELIRMARSAREAP